jgi:hypothetical protein
MVAGVMHQASARLAGVRQQRAAAMSTPRTVQRKAVPPQPAHGHAFGVPDVRFQPPEPRLVAHRCMKAVRRQSHMGKLCTCFSSLRVDVGAIASAQSRDCSLVQKGGPSAHAAVGRPPQQNVGQRRAPTVTAIVVA